MPKDDGLFSIANSSAVFDPTGKYRYLLSRIWNCDYLEDDTKKILWIMLNPSTADAHKDDPTIRRCIAFSKQWGFSGLEIVNLFALRSPSPKHLFTVNDPVGPENVRHIQEALERHECSHVIGAWGNTPLSIPTAIQSLLLPLRNLYALKITQRGYPAHPLYISSKTWFIPYMVPQ